MTTIEWSDETWNPTVGCSRVSAGCDHCYAMGVAHRKMTARHRGLTILRPATAARPGIDWNGKVRLVPEVLDKPMGWRKPRRVFVDSMSDLFHPQVPFEFIAAVFGVMAACPQHTFQLLSKRPQRMVEFFARPVPWPLPNVHLGVSVEDQATADERIPLLLQCPAALRFVSYEPALGPVDFTAGGWLCCGAGDRGGPHVDWIIVGGESGPGARLFDLAWARSVLEQCEDTGTKVFVKQLGAKPFSWHETETSVRTRLYLKLTDSSGGDMDEWHDDLRVREAPPCTSPAWNAAMARFGS